MTKKLQSRAMLAAVGMTVATAFSAPAFAQTDTQEPSAQQADPSTQGQTAPSASFDDAKLDSFAVAFLQVDKVRREYTPKMKSAAEDDQQKIQTEAGQKMIQAVEDADGISVDEYNTIIQSAQADPDLAQRVNNVIQEKSDQ